MRKSMRTLAPRSPLPLRLALLSLALLSPAAREAAAQSHDHAAEAAPTAPAGPATPNGPEAAPAGQAAFEAIAGVVARLQADPDTDWTRVDIEALRRHLVDMDRVLTLTDIEAAPVPGGARFTVRGTGETVGSIRRMAAAHVRALAGDPHFRARVEPAEGGANVTVTTADGSPETVARIRGLGFAGLLVLDDHHGPHHWMLASGSKPAGH